MKKITENKRCLLLGVTGGIASGKTVVSGMLGALGAKTIDFDILAREVVEPGKPAWKHIVEYFGEQVLMQDNTLDRKKLSDIVFKDAEKRKTLERFTHPEIGAEFVRRVEEVIEKDPEAIIQAVVPLLIEGNMQKMFDKVIVVYAPPEVQIKRLVLRDKLSKGQAANILLSQLPIDQKIKFADFVIRNDNSLEDTREQVEALWQTLSELQKKKSGRSNSA